jgi:hypothetical protein
MCIYTNPPFYDLELLKDFKFSKCQCDILVLDPCVSSSLYMTTLTIMRTGILPAQQVVERGQETDKGE